MAHHFEMSAQNPIGPFWGFLPLFVWFIGKPVHKPQWPMLEPKVNGSLVDLGTRVLSFALGGGLGRGAPDLGHCEVGAGVKLQPSNIWLGLEGGSQASGG